MDFLDFLYQALTEGWKLWLIVGIVFFFAEGVNPGTFALFFGGAGALTTAAACRMFAAVAENGTYQLLIFAAMSVLSLLLLRPRIMRAVQNEAKLDGPDAYVGKHAKTLTVLSQEGGRILFEGTEWAAAPSEDCLEEIPADSPVEVVKMEGLTIRVRPVLK